MKRQFKKIILCSLFFLMLTNFSSNQTYTKGLLMGKSKDILPLLKGTNYKLQTNAYDALQKMINAAFQKGVKIDVVSAYRSFDHQNRLWKTKYDKFRSRGYSVKAAVSKVIEYTAIPGTSRHHWGTEVDLRDYSKRNTKYLESNSKSKYQNWMQDNAHKYGFYLAYTNNKFRKGYNYESWHYSYREISKPMLNTYLKLDINKMLKNENIVGNIVFTKNFMNKYVEEHVLGINDYLY